jgi:hypothetical protein
VRVETTISNFQALILLRFRLQVKVVIPRFPDYYGKFETFKNRLIRSTNRLYVQFRFPVPMVNDDQHYVPCQRMMTNRSEGLSNSILFCVSYSCLFNSASFLNFFLHLIHLNFFLKLEFISASIIHINYVDQGYQKQSYHVITDPKSF